MFNFFKRKRKCRKVLTILEESTAQIEKQNEDLKEVIESIRKDRIETEKKISEIESALLTLGYTKEDLEKIRLKSKFKVLGKDLDS